MPERLLTWHAGSILPYASLWHTVLRACSLNALRAGDLRNLTHAARRGPFSVELIENATQRVDVAAFANELGESPGALRWSTLGTLPSWLRLAIVVPHPRICLACLATGYHAALFSINLLDECPIHGTPLVSYCHCGAPFQATLRRAADYGAAGSCRCGRMHFFTRETCRRPALPAAETRAFEPVVAWLESCCTLIRPKLLEEALMQHAAGSLYWLASAARALGVPWPSCFRPLQDADLQWLAVHQLAKADRALPASRIRPPPKARPPPITAFWGDTADVTVYRALARHIRRHIAPHSTRIVRSFVATANPLEIGQRIQSDVRALRAFTDVLWSRAIEPEVELRRWPGRRPPCDVVGTLRRQIAAGCSVQGAIALPHAQARWAGYHAARVTLGAVWHEAKQRSALVAHTGLAEWSDTESYSPWNKCAWLARATPDGSQFVTTAASAWGTAPHATKSERRAMHTCALEQRRDAMLADHSGACLTWSRDAGWTVMDTIEPAELDLRRRRLFGFTGKRLWCWIYRTREGKFATRLAGTRLQAIGATPGDAIAALRRSAADYQRICHVALPHTPAVPLVKPEPMDPMLADSYHALVSDVRHFGGFWRAGPELGDAARRYQRARSRGSRQL